MIIPELNLAAASVPANTIAGRMLAFVRDRGDAVFLRSVDAKLETREFTYRNFFHYAMIVAHLYDRHQIPVGAPVVLVLSNPEDVFRAVAAALLTGRVPIVSAHPSPKLSLADFGRTLLPLIANAKPALIVADPEHCAFLSAAVGQRVASLADLEVPEKLPPLAQTDNATLFLQYSSGTTGTKKGVAISPRQLLWQVNTYARAIGLGPNDHIVSWLPFYHDMGLITSLMLPLLTGTPVTVMSPFDWVKNPLMLLRVIARDRGTLTWLPNFAYNFLVEAARRAELSGLDLSSLRGVVNCSEPLSAESHDLFLTAFRPYGLKDTALAASYAMAETTFAITSGGFGRPLAVDQVDRAQLAMGHPVTAGSHTVVSSGRALPETEVHIIDTSGRGLPPRHVGQIIVRSPSLMNGYFGNLDATHAAFASNYFLTGDMGYIDKGEVFVTGRLKDLIITAGRNIYPQDIEAVVSDLPDVIGGRCVAFGLPDAQRGTESVVVIAERAEGTDARRVATAIAQAVTARFDISLAQVKVVEAGWLKKSTSGKIARGQNRERYLAERETTTAPQPDAPTSPEDIARHCVLQVTGVWVEDATAPLVTSGLVDSLALTNLLLALEEAFGKPMPAPEAVGYDAYDSIQGIAKVATGPQTTASPAAVIALVIDRQVKANYVLEGPRDFDGLILGSSRSFTIRAKHAATYGLNAFQFACAGVRFEELYCAFAFFRDTNRAPLKHIILGTDPIQFSPHLPIDVRFEKSPALFRYLDDIDQRFAGTLKREDEVDADNDPARLKRLTQMMRVRYNAWDVDLSFDPRTGDLIRMFGERMDEMPRLSFDLAKSESAWVQQFLAVKDLTYLHPRRLEYLDRFLQMTEEMGCAVSLYTNPLHPQMVTQMKERTPYMKSQERLVAHIREARRKNVRVFAFESPADFGGDDADYFDGVHMGRFNGDLIVDTLLKP